MHDTKQCKIQYLGFIFVLIRIVPQPTEEHGNVRARVRLGLAVGPGVLDGVQSHLLAYKCESPVRRRLLGGASPACLVLGRISRAYESPSRIAAAASGITRLMLAANARITIS